MFNDHPEIIMTYSDYEYMDESSRQIKVVSLPDFSYSEMVLKNVCVPGPGAFWRRSAFMQAGEGWNVRLRQTPDVEFWLRLGLQGEFHHIDMVLARFRVHGGSQTCSAGDVSKADEMVTVMEGYFTRGDLPADVQATKAMALANAGIFSAALHLMACRFSHAFSHLWRAITLSPLSLTRPANIRRLGGGGWHCLRNRGS